MPRIVVLGTGTGVGKTYFTVALARALAGPRSDPVLAIKPVETGLPKCPGAREATDAIRLAEASTVEGPSPHPLFGFPDPISPHLAARRAGRPISLRSVASWVARAERDIALRGIALRWTIVETAGGALSPLIRSASNVDLATALDPAIVILVAPDALGVLHDMRATLAALALEGRVPDFVVLSAARRSDPSTGTNAAELARLGIVRPIATLPRRGRPEHALAPLVSALRRRIKIP